MKRSLIGLLLAMPIGAQAQTPSEILDACKVGVESRDAVKLSRCVGFVQGAERLREFTNVVVVGASPKWRNPICTPDTVSIGQLARVLVKYLEDHPNQLHEHVGALYMMALMDAFPCSDK